MKESFFKCLRRLTLMLLAAVGFAVTSPAQNWSVVKTVDLTNTTEGTYDDVIAKVTNLYVDNDLGEVKYLNLGGTYNFYFLSSGSSDSYFCLTETLAPGKYRFTYTTRILNASSQFYSVFYSAGEPETAEKNMLAPDLELTTSFKDYSYEFTVTEEGKYNMGYVIDKGEGLSAVICKSFKLEKESDLPLTYSVELVKTGEGSVTVTDAEDNELDFSEGPVSVAANSVLTVTAEPKDDTYECTELTYTVGDGEEQDVPENGEITVTGDVTVNAVFAKKQYAVSYEIAAGEGTVGLQDADGKPVGEKVEAGTVVTVVAEAADGYTLESIKVGDTPLVKDDKEQYTYTVNAETKFVVTFAEEEVELKEYTVSWTAPKNGKLVVLNAADTVKSGDKILEKTVLTVKAIPADSTYTVAEVKDGETVLEAGNDGVYSVEVKADVKLSATFEKIKYSVTWDEPVNGRLIIKNGNDTIKSGDMINAGTTLVVLTQPDENYELTSLTYKVGDEEAADVKNGSITLTGNTVVAATFALVKYEFTYDIAGGEWVADVTVTDRSGNEIKSGAVLDYGTEYIVKAVKKKDQYYYVNMLVNDEQVVAKVSGLTYTYNGKVTGKTHVKVDLFSDINTVGADAVYYDGETMTLYTGGAGVKVYDMSGRVVINAEKAESVSAAELNDGYYTAVVGNVVLKFRK